MQTSNEGMVVFSYANATIPLVKSCKREKRKLKEVITWSFVVSVHHVSQRTGETSIIRQDNLVSLDKNQSNWGDWEFKTVFTIHNPTGPTWVKFKTAFTVHSPVQYCRTTLKIKVGGIFF